MAVSKVVDNNNDNTLLLASLVEIFILLVVIKMSQDNREQLINVSKNVMTDLDRTIFALFVIKVKWLKNNPNKSFFNWIELKVPLECLYLYNKDYLMPLK